MVLVLSADFIERKTMGDLTLKDIHSKLLPGVNPDTGVENLFIAINLHSNKWLISD